MKLDCSITEKTFLYHGTIDLYGKYIEKNGIKIIERRKVYTDFGTGFYLTVDNEYQAKIWARAMAKVPKPHKNVLEYLGITYEEFLEFAPNAKGVVLKFCIPKEKIELFNSLNSKKFLDVNLAWKEFIIENRQGISNHSYDWVFGSVADGGINSLYASDVEPKKNQNQLSVHTRQAIDCLKLLEVIVC